MISRPAKMLISYYFAYEHLFLAAVIDYYGSLLTIGKLLYCSRIIGR